MEDPISKREQTLIEKYGSAEAVKQKRQEWQQKSRKNAKPGGFYTLKQTDPDKLREMSVKGANALWKKRKDV